MLLEYLAPISVEVTSKQWSQNVLNSSTRVSTKLRVSKGKHVLRIYMVDPGVVIDKLVLDTGGVRSSYLGPPETRVVGGGRRAKGAPTRIS